MTPRPHPRAFSACALALALLAAGCGGNPAVPDTAEVVTKTPPPGSSPATDPAPAAPTEPTTAPAEAKP